MKLKWRNEIIKGLADDIPTAERYDWILWLLIAVASLAGLAYLYMEVM